MVVVETWLKSDVGEEGMLEKKQRWPCLFERVDLLVRMEGSMALFADVGGGVITAFGRTTRACTSRFPKKCARNARS
jgi:hypothetical protein